MYYGLTFLSADQCKTIRDDITYSTAWAKLLEWIQEWNEKQEMLYEELYKKCLKVLLV